MYQEEEVSKTFLRNKTFFNDSLSKFDSLIAFERPPFWP